MQLEETINIELTLESERKIWNHLLGIGLIPFPQNCPSCNNSVAIKENDTLNNPYLARCSNSKCRKTIYLRTNTFFDRFPRTPISIIRYIIYLSLHHNKNGTEIYKELKYINLQYNVSQNHIFEILEFMRRILAHYLKDTYLLENITEEDKDESIAIDESLFIHDNHAQVWILGLINNRSRIIRLEILENRTQNTMKKIIERLVPKGNRIVTDNAACYHFLDRLDSGYDHSIHTHGHGDFGTGLDSTSHIEQLWKHLKDLIKGIYILIPKNNFVLFLREAEWRRNYSKFDSNRISEISAFEEAAKYVYSVSGNKLYDNNYLLKLTADS